MESKSVSKYKTIILQEQCVNKYARQFLRASFIPDEHWTAARYVWDDRTKLKHISQMHWSDNFHSWLKFKPITTMQVTPKQARPVLSVRELCVDVKTIRTCSILGRFNQIPRLSFPDTNGQHLLMFVLWSTRYHCRWISVTPWPPFSWLFL